MTFPLMPMANPVSGGTATATYITSRFSNNNAYTYNFTGTAIGTATDTRLVVVCAAINVLGAGSYFINRISIGGVTATTAVQSASNTNCAIAYLLVPTGTTANIVVSLGGTGTPGRCQIDVFNVTGWSSQTPSSVGSTNATAGTSISVTTGSSTGDCAISVCFTYLETFTSSWSSPMIDVGNYEIEDSRTTAAYGNNIPRGPFTATVTKSVSSTSTMSIATWS